MTDRTRAIGYAAMAGVIVFALIGFGIDASKWRPPFWLATPSAAAFFGLLFTWYDRSLWRKAPCGIRLSRIPDLGGQWGGQVDIMKGPRRQEEGLAGVPCFVEISQTWSKISVDFETPFSRSVSSMALLSDKTFHYEYAVAPKLGTQYPEGMAIHGGLARLHSGDHWQTLKGAYFNDEHYQRIGRYVLARLESETTFDAWIVSREAPKITPIEAESDR